jgi:hypothetical protein
MQQIQSISRHQSPTLTVAEKLLWLGRVNPPPLPANKTIEQITRAVQVEIV